MARIKPGVPTVKEIREGESEYRYISGTGLVLYTRYNNRLYSTKMHEAPTPPIMDKKLEVAIGDRVSSSLDEGEFIKADGSITFTGNQSHGGNDITGVNDLTVSDDVTIGDDLDVDGHTTLDQVTVNTADGAFAVSGANPINLTTTGTNDINITTAQTLDVGIGVDYELDVTRTCDWNTATVDWDNSNTFDLTSVGNITIETSAATTDKKILIQNTNNHASDFTGIHIKTNSQGAGSSFNGILIECDNVAGKGGTAGIDIRSENGIRIRSENDNSGGTTHILMRATGPIDIGVAASITAHTTNNRVKIHGSNGIDFAVLYRESDDSVIDTTDAVFNKIDTNSLTRALTYKSSTTVAYFTDATCDTTSGDPTVTHDSNKDILAGMKVTGNGIPANTYVGSVTSATEFELSAAFSTTAAGSAVNATANQTNVTLTFYQPDDVIDDNYYSIVTNANSDRNYGTAWIVNILWNEGLSNENGQLWYLFDSGSINTINLLSGSSASDYPITWASGTGIIWRNTGGSQAEEVRASALRLQGSADFS